MNDSPVPLRKTSLDRKIEAAARRAVEERILNGPNRPPAPQVKKPL